MKKFIIVVLCVALLLVGIDTAYYRLGAYIDFNPSISSACIFFIQAANVSFVITHPKDFLIVPTCYSYAQAVLIYGII